MATRAELEAAVRKACKLGQQILDLDDGGTWTWDECDLFGELLDTLRGVLKAGEPSIPVGTRVRMSEAYEAALIANGCFDHAREFHSNVGVVVGQTFPGTKQPEVDVRWEPDFLRYAYHPDNLVVVDG